MTPAHQVETTIFYTTINPDPNSSVGPKVGERPVGSGLTNVLPFTRMRNSLFFS